MTETQQSLPELVAARRRGLGATYEQLAQVLGMDSSTIRKYEQGRIRRCRRRNEVRLRELVQGCYDAKVREKQRWRPGGETSDGWQSLPLMAQRSLGRVAEAYTICGGNAHLQEQLLDEVHQSARRLMALCVDHA